MEKPNSKGRIYWSTPILHRVFTHSAITTKNNTNSQHNLNSGSSYLVYSNVPGRIRMWNIWKGPLSVKNLLIVVRKESQLSVSSGRAFGLLSKRTSVNNLGDTSCWRTGCRDACLPLQLGFCFSIVKHVWFVIVLLHYWGVMVALPKFHGCKITSSPLLGDLHVVQRMTDVSGTWTHGWGKSCRTFHQKPIWINRLGGEQFGCNQDGKSSGDNRVQVL